MNIFKKIVTSIVSIYTDAKAESEMKIALAEKKKIDRESPVCPYCKKVHRRGDLKGAATRKSYIDIGQHSRITFVTCPNCKEVFCLIIYLDSGIGGNLLIDGFAIHDKKENKNVD
jgi:uncharacterized Zn-finger protein